MGAVVGVVVGLVIGFIVGWLIRDARARPLRAPGEGFGIGVPARWHEREQGRRPE